MTFYSQPYWRAAERSADETPTPAGATTAMRLFWEGGGVALLANRSYTDQIVESAKKWASADERVKALLLYGSVHRKEVHHHSDVDLIIVGHRGRREQLWRSRQEVAATLLGRSPAWSHKLDWQGPYRFQAWTPSLAAVDLTFDEAQLEHHDVLADGYTMLYGAVDNTTKPSPQTTHVEPDVDLERLGFGCSAYMAGSYKDVAGTPTAGWFSCSTQGCGR